MMEPVMMEEESERLAAKPEVSYFGTGQRTAGRARLWVCVCVSSYLIKYVTPSSLKLNPLSYNATLG